eukprot:743041-Pyramimonas_sp.AAC.1
MHGAEALVAPGARPLHADRPCLRLGWGGAPETHKENTQLYFGTFTTHWKYHCVCMCFPS